MNVLAAVFIMCWATFFTLGCMAESLEQRSKVSDLPVWASGYVEPFHADLTQ